MRAELVPSAQIDVCDACGGIWLDWFDGDVQRVAAEAEAARVERGMPHVGSIPPSPAAPAGAGLCPRCAERLGPELFRFADARDDELLAGVELLRCGACAGAFIPRPSAILLLDRVREGRPVSIWEALVALIRHLLAPSED